jgi:hypothetical protein
MIPRNLIYFGQAAEQSKPSYAGFVMESDGI